MKRRKIWTRKGEQRDIGKRVGEETNKTRINIWDGEVTISMGWKGNDIYGMDR